MKTINCAECNKEVEYEPPKNYPDKRKYCTDCSAKKKATWEAAKNKVKEEFTPEVIPMNEKKTPQNDAAPIKEFHLSPEQVRTNALDLALKLGGLSNVDDALIIARIIEEYLWNGK